MMLLVDLVWHGIDLLQISPILFGCYSVEWSKLTSSTLKEVVLDVLVLNFGHGRRKGPFLVP